ncbi:putative 18K protein [Pyrrhocoris apterus virus 1]|nr:putative 18K protein [Pyrrhocoris apterus virus 1]
MQYTTIMYFSSIIAFALNAMVLGFNLLVLDRFEVYDFQRDYTDRFIKDILETVNFIAKRNKGTKFYLFNPSYNTTKLDKEIFKDHNGRFHSFAQLLRDNKEIFYIYHFLGVSPFTTYNHFKTYLNSHPLPGLFADTEGFYCYRHIDDL